MKHLLNGLTAEPKVELISVKKTILKEKNKVECLIVCNEDSVTTDLNLLKKIIATMEIIKELYSKYNIDFRYTLSTINLLESDNIDENKKIIKLLKNAEIYYLNNPEYLETINRMNEKTHKRA